MDVRSKKIKKMDFWIVSVYILMLFCLKSADCLSMK